MSLQGAKKPEKDVKTRGYKFLLFADNKQHMRAYRAIKRLYPNDYVGCWHIQFDDNGKEIMTGSHKKHMHIICHFPNGIHWHALCKKVGLVKADGSPDYQFCRAIGYDKKSDTVQGGYQYLTHANDQTKEQYSPDRLFGAKSKIEEARKAIVAYFMRNITMAECVLHCVEWIDVQDKIIRMRDFAFWVCGTPYFKASSSPVVRGCIQEHNDEIYRQMRKAGIEYRMSEIDYNKNQRFDTIQSRGWVDLLDLEDVV